MDELDYAANTVNFANSRASSEAGSNDAGATIRISSSANDTRLVLETNVSHTSLIYLSGYTILTLQTPLVLMVKLLH